MKTFIFVCGFFLISPSLHAQFFDPLPMNRLNGTTFTYVGIPQTININFADTSIFAVSTDHIFALGSQWGVPTRSLAKRIHHRFYNEKIEYHNESYKNIMFDTLLEHLPRNNGTMHISFNLYALNGDNFSVAHRWSPGIAAPTATHNGSDWNFSPPADDTNGLVFGFWHREGGTVMPNYSYKITTDSATVNGGRLILSQPVNNLYKNGGIPFYSGKDTAVYNKDKVARNGRHWYFSITLNRADALYNDSTSSDDTVLTIKIPVRYMEKTPSGTSVRYQSLQFDSILQVGTQTANIQYHSRGGFMDTRLVFAPDKDSILTIRRSMLPKFSDTSHITLSGYFMCPVNEDDLPGHPNPSFPPENNTAGIIDSLNVEIYYHGKCNITIRDCMIGTQMSRWVFRGERDTIMYSVPKQQQTIKD